MDILRNTILLAFLCLFSSALIGADKVAEQIVNDFEKDKQSAIQKLKARQDALTKAGMAEEAKEVEEMIATFAEGDDSAVEKDPSGNKDSSSDCVFITALNTNEAYPKEKILSKYFEQDLFCGIPGTSSWDFKLNKSGSYYFHAYYAADESRPAIISVNKKEQGKILAEVTGGWNTQQLKWFTYGPYKFKKGKNTISLKFEGVPTIRGFCISSSKEPPKETNFPPSKFDAKERNEGEKR